MSVFRPNHIHLVEQALHAGPSEGMTGKQVWEATDRAVPERIVHLILGDMVHRGVAERESSPRGFQRRMKHVFRVV